ncbi:MAG: helix-turn-helix domain-containing protein [Actinobacteria bacterium]|nr:helix-turn-helix domain-containing protein [Actinomycetota bacterium]
MDTSQMARQPTVVQDERAVQRENALLRELVTVYQHLTGLTLQDADVSTVLQLLARRTAATVAVVSRGLEVTAAAGPDLPDDQVAANVRDYVAARRLSSVLNSTAQTRRSLRLPETGDSAGVIVAPILVGDDVPAYLLTFGKPDADGGDMSLLITEHAATICGVILGRERVVAAAARQVRDDLMEGLLLGTAHGNGEVGRWARHLGYDASREHRVLTVAIEATGSAGATGSATALWQRVAVAIDHFFTTRMSGAIIAIRDGEVVIVAPDTDGSEANRLSAACLTRMRDLFPEAVVTIGIGSSCRDPAEIARSYGQARRTIDAVVRLGRQGQAVAFEDLGIHRLLLQVPDLAELKSFSAEILGELDRQDPQRGAELLTTLACYFRENNSPQRTAQSLHVHPNTVAYRIRRVQEITGLRLDTYRDRLMAQVAIEIVAATEGGMDALHAPDRVAK